MEHAEHGNSNAPMEYQSETGRLNILGFWITCTESRSFMYIGNKPVDLAPDEAGTEKKSDNCPNDYAF